MMKRTAIILLMTLMLDGCKKEKLSGDDEKYAGVYTWKYTCGGIFPSCEDPESTGKNLKLEIFEKGKYKLYSNGKNVGHGRMIRDNKGYLTFENDELIGTDILNGQRILGLRNDSLDIGVAYCCDTKVALYIKNY